MFLFLLLDCIKIWNYMNRFIVLEKQKLSKYTYVYIYINIIMFCWCCLCVCVCVSGAFNSLCCFFFCFVSVYYVIIIVILFCILSVYFFVYWFLFCFYCIFRRYSDNRNCILINKMRIQYKHSNKSCYIYINIIERSISALVL